MCISFRKKEGGPLKMPRPKWYQQLKAEESRMKQKAGWYHQQKAEDRWEIQKDTEQ